MNTFFHRVVRKKELLVLLTIWTIIQSFLLIINGIKIDGEGSRFIPEAYNLINKGSLSTANYYMYFLEIFLIYLKIKIGFGFGLIVFVQLAANLLALLYLNIFLSRYYTSKALAVLSCSLLVICYPYQVYNTFLYTESFFFSFSLIYSCYLLSITRFEAKNIFILLALMILLCITRPTGIFFFGASIIYLFFKLSRALSLLKRAALFFILSVIALLILNILMGSGGGIDIILPFKDERVICDVPTLPYNVDIKTITNGNSLYGLYYYILHNFDQFSRLALLKSKAFFGLTRPYYSAGHNFFIVTFFYSLYLFIILAIARFKVAIPTSFTYFFSLIIITWVSVVFSCDEWHNRFFLSLTPFLIIPAVYLFKKKSTD